MGTNHVFEKGNMLCFFYSIIDLSGLAGITQTAQTFHRCFGDLVLQYFFLNLYDM